MDKILSDWLEANVDKPTEAFRGLPNEAYTSDAFFREERKHIFLGGWVYAISKSEIPEPGDCTPVEVAGQPLIVVHRRDGMIRCFMNVCPHRGSRLLNEGASKLRQITCPYHAWSFELSGALRGRPHYYGPEKHDKDGASSPDCSLFEVRSGQWQDWIFVNIDGNAPPLEDWFDSVREHFAPHDFSSFRLGTILTFEFQANWKLAVENYTDNYHVFSIHPDLHDLMDKHERYAMETDRTSLLSGYVLTRAGRGEGLPDYPGYAETPRKARFSMTFPTFGCAVYPSSMAIAIFKPLAVDRTEMRMLFYYAGDAATSDEMAPYRKLNEDTWTELNAEDEGICQMIQQGREAAAYDGGRFSPYWDRGTVHYAKLIAAGMQRRYGDMLRKDGGADAAA